jgi:ankyrin repeat protein
VSEDLIDAASRGDDEEVSRILHEGGCGDRELAVALGAVACHLSAEREAAYVACGDLLIEAGADVDGEWTPRYGPILFAACEYQNPLGIEYLLARGASVTIPSARARRYAGNEAVKMVLASHSRASNARRHDSLALLLAHGAAWPDDICAELRALYLGDVAALAALLARDSDLVARRYEHDGGNVPLSGATLLHVAAEYNEVACAELLLERGADIDGAAGDGPTPIFHTVASDSSGCLDALALLVGRADLAARATFEAFSYATEDLELFDSVTPLGFALASACTDHPPEPWWSHEREIALLLEHGAAQ